jgi:hypothetical protein
VVTLDDEGYAYVGEDWMVAPRLSLTKDTSLTFDARTAKRVDVTVPDPGAAVQSASVNVIPENIAGNPVTLTNYGLSEGFGIQQVGPRPKPGTVYSTLLATLANGDTEYLLGNKLKDGFYNGYTQHAKWKDLAKLTVRQGSTKSPRWGALYTEPDFLSPPSVLSTTLPHTATMYLQGSIGWKHTFQQQAVVATEAEYRLPSTVYRAGHEYTETFNSGVFGPSLTGGAGGVGSTGLVRDGNRLTGAVQPFADGAGHEGESSYDPATASTTLYRNGKKYATGDDVLDAVGFDLPKDKARYRLVTTVSRVNAAVSTVSTEVTWSAEFTSGHTAKPTALPASVVRYTPDIGLDSTAVAGARQTVPVTVQGSAAGRDLKSLTVYASYDRGATWSRTQVHHGNVTVVNPAAGGSVSFKAEVKDQHGGSFSQTVLDAYRTR